MLIYYQCFSLFTPLSFTNRYCLGIGATLPMYHDLQTRDYILALMARIGFSAVHVGLSLNPRTKTFTEWMDGSPITSKWNGGEPSGLPEGCAVQTSSYLNDILCGVDLKYVICQQPVEGKCASKGISIATVRCAVLKQQIKLIVDILQPKRYNQNCLHRKGSGLHLQFFL